MRDLKHIHFFENLLEQADNELVREKKAEGGVAAGYTCYYVPEVLLNGNHAEIRRWRRRESLAATLRFRPDLLETAALSPEDLKILKELENECSSES